MIVDVGCMSIIFKMLISFMLLVHAWFGALKCAMQGFYIGHCGGVGAWCSCCCDWQSSLGAQYVALEQPLELAHVL